MNDEFMTAVREGDTAAVRTLLASDASLAHATDERGVSALLIAVYHGRAEIATILLDAGIEPDVFEAAATGRTERVRALVAKDPELVRAVSVDGFSPLGLASFFGHLEAVEALLAAGADPKTASSNAMRVAPIHSASASGRVDVVRLLLDGGADPNARQQGGIAPLHQAAKAGNLELVRLLVERGADPRAETDDGRTPLAFALEAKRDEVARCLREHGAT